jgi:hypothetical protein
MTNKIFDTIIIGAGIAGLSCGKRLQEFNKDFLIISKDIGGRILTSDDGEVNYGAFFVCSDYYYFLKYIKLKTRIRLRDFCFHDKDKKFVLFEPKLIFYIMKYIRLFKIQFKFRKKLRQLREKSVTISQKKIIENDKFLNSLYMKNAKDFVNDLGIQKLTNTYLSKALYSTTFSRIHEMNAYSFLQFLLPLITPIYNFKFDKDKMIKSFKDKILIGCVTDIKFKNNKYEIKSNNKVYYCKNIVLATPITWSKNFVKIKKINKSISTNMLHIEGAIQEKFSKKLYHLFSPFENVQAIADLKNGTYLTYYKKELPNLKKIFKKHKIIYEHFWNPAGTINGNNLIECYRGNNMYLIGDYNIAGLEEAFITGLYAANQIINSN